MCGFFNCERKAKFIVDCLNETVADGTTDGATVYCSRLHAGIDQIAQWASENKTGALTKRLYKTATGVLRKLAHAVEKEWQATESKK